MKTILEELKAKGIAVVEITFDGREIAGASRESPAGATTTKRFRQGTWVELPSVPEPPDLEWVVSELALASLGLLLEA